MIILIGIAIILSGALMGWLLYDAVVKKYKSGTLKIDISDPDGPYLFLELDEGISTIQGKDYIVLKVDITNYLSRD